MTKVSFEDKRIAAARTLGVAPEGVPRHIAIIMDGNGRWAEKQGQPRFYGHSKGGSIVEKIALYCVDLGVEYLTLYSFSMQNWKRPKDEIDFLMGLYSLYLEGIRDTFMDNNVRLAHLGSLDRLPQKVVDTLGETIAMTSGNDGMTLGLALNYGSRTEITEGVRAIAKECLEGKLKIEDIDHDCISDHLYTAGWPDPDLLIRTSGEMRVSNYLLWQISYSEFYITEKYWPEFDTCDLDEAIKVFAKRSRRLGDVKPQSNV
jgi:undecaprenyl diphosphate synthase